MLKEVKRKCVANLALSKKIFINVHVFCIVECTVSQVFIDVGRSNSGTEANVVVLLDSGVRISLTISQKEDEVKSQCSHRKIKILEMHHI